jgi:tetratricopeptide (TPR) repeat protein
MKRRLALALLVLVATATALLLGGVLRGADGERGSVPAGAAAATLQGPFAGNDTASLVRQLQVELRAHPTVKDYGLLGLAYQQRARETGDPTYYTKSDGVLHRALALDPNDLVATGALGSLALARHRFREALRLGRRARALSPSTARSYGVIGDALIELGRYRDAFAAFNRMARLRPSLSSYARVSYARELVGDVPGARRAMARALDAARGQQEPFAWTAVQLGKLDWATGRLEAAARWYRAALHVFPGYVYGLDALAQVQAARGHPRAAAALETQAVDAIPLPQFVGSLGDLDRRLGRVSEAWRQYRLIGVIQRLLAANGVKTDLETALFDVDHAIDLPRALRLARQAHADRPSIDGDDVLAWALARNGRCAAALPWSERALRLGTHDALKFFHRGAIERCLGNDASARIWLRRALALNAHFSLLWAPVAHRWLG